jgi:hypothetical protein
MVRTPRRATAQNVVHARREFRNTDANGITGGDFTEENARAR